MNCINLKRNVLGLAILAFLAGWAVTARGDELAARLRPIIEAHEGEVAVAVKHLAGGGSFSHRADEPMPTASLIKFPVMIEAYRQAHEGKIDLKKMVTLRDEDKVPGSGVLTSPLFRPARRCRSATRFG